jgi:hypothetical protein
VEAATNILNTLQPLGAEKFNVLTTVDESYFPFNPSRQRSKVWLAPNAKKPQCPKVKKTAAKTLLLLAFTPNKRFHVRCLPPGQMMNSEAYIDFLRNTGEKWRTLRSNPIHLSDILLMQDNARPHCSHKTTAFLTFRSVQCLRQSPYSPDLNLCDRWAFRYLKNQLADSVFDDEEDVKRAALQALRRVDEMTLQHEVNKLLAHCQSIITNNGHYVIE